MLFSARIKELEGQLAAAISERDTFIANNADLVTANADFSARHDADVLALGTANASLEEVRTQLATMTSERDAALAQIETPEAHETAIATAVNQRLADAGAPPIKRDAKAAVDSAETGKGRTASTWN